MMVLTDKVIINSIDVTSKRISWSNLEEWDNAIGTLEIKFAPSLTDLLEVTNGLEITVQRGFITSTDEYVFRGVITQVKPDSTKIILICKNPMLDAIKSNRTKSWDKDIDVEAGVGSEIFKDICDHSQLAYNDDSIPTTGTDDTDKIIKFVQSEEDDFDRMNELATRYSRTITYDYDNELTTFKPKGFVTYPVELTVGTEIQNQLLWKDNMEQLCNKVTINGATVYDKINPAVFAGPASTFTLSKTPEDTEVRDSSSSGTLYVRGQKDVGTIDVDYDYYVDVESKKIIFSSDKTNVWVRYGAQVPMPVVRKNQTSIDTYGGPNKIAHHKHFTFTDLKDISDASDKAYSILTKYSTPFYEIEKVAITDSVIIANGNIAPGTLIHINDNFNNKFRDVFVKIVTKAFPHTGDVLTVGDEIWRIEDWQTDITKKVNQLLNDLNKNQDILTQIFDVERDTIYERRYFKGYKRDATEDGAWGVGFGDGSTSTRYDWGDTGALWQASYTNAEVLTHLNQGNNIYREFLYDADFEGTGTATWDITNKEIAFTSGQTRTTDLISKGHIHTYFTVKHGVVTGTILTEISGDGGSTWQTVTLGTRTKFTSSTIAGVQIRVTENATTTATIENTYLDDGRYDSPAIYCKLEG